jgi:hypothetical protein
VPSGLKQKQTTPSGCILTSSSSCVDLGVVDSILDVVDVSSDSLSRDDSDWL